MLENEIKLVATLPETHVGMRLDQSLALCFPEHSRSRLTQWIKEGNVKVENQIQNAPRYKIKGGEIVELNAHMKPIDTFLAQDIPLHILYEDESLIILNKPANLVVHPAAGNWELTLLNALLHHHPALQNLPRAGIVHRLDKDTTGIMVVAKTLTAHTYLVNALQRRKIKREYLALVAEEVIAGSTIDAPIGRHPIKRTKMAVNANGKPAITHYRCEKRYEGFTLLRVTLETGRTHQIRVHLSHQGYPIVGDALYGWRLKFPPKASSVLIENLKHFQRQALHAKSLTLNHPETAEILSWEAPLPEDMCRLLDCLPRKER